MQGKEHQFISYLCPVVGHLLQAETLADVDQAEDVLLEAGAAKADTRLKELAADPGVATDRLRHIGNVGPDGLTDGRHCVNGGDSLGQESVRRQFRHLAGPGAQLDDSIVGNPVTVDAGQFLHGRLALLSRLASYQHPVGVH